MNPPPADNQETPPPTAQRSVDLVRDVQAASHALRNVLSAVLLNARVARLELPATTRADVYESLDAIEQVVTGGRLILQGLEATCRDARMGAEPTVLRPPRDRASCAATPSLPRGTLPPAQSAPWPNA